MATYSSILAWKIPWREDPGRLQSLRLQRLGHDWTCTQTHVDPKLLNCLFPHSSPLAPISSFSFCIHSNFISTMPLRGRCYCIFKEEIFHLCPYIFFFFFETTNDSLQACWVLGSCFVYSLVPGNPWGWSITRVWAQAASLKMEKSNSSLCQNLPVTPCIWPTFPLWWKSTFKYETRPSFQNFNCIIKN